MFFMSRETSKVSKILNDDLFIKKRKKKKLIWCPLRDFSRHTHDTLYSVKIRRDVRLP